MKKSTQPYGLNFGPYRPFHPQLAIALGRDQGAAMLLTYLLWMQEGSEGIAFTVPQLSVALGLGRAAVDRCRKALVDRGFLVERATRACIYARVDVEAVRAWWTSTGEEASRSRTDRELRRFPAQQPGHTLADPRVGNQPSAASETSAAQGREPAHGASETGPLINLELPINDPINIRRSDADAPTEPEPIAASAEHAAGTDRSQLPDHAPNQLPCLPSAASAGSEGTNENRARETRARRGRKAKAIADADVVTIDVVVDSQPAHASMVPAAPAQLTIANNEASGPVSDDRALARVDHGTAIENAAAARTLRNGVLAVRQRKPPGGKGAVYLVRDGDVPKPEMRGLFEGALDAEHLGAADFERVMRALTAIRVGMQHLEAGASYDAGDCALVRRYLSAGYRPSDIAKAVVGASRDPWWAQQRAGLKRILANLDTLIAAGVQGAASSSKEDAAREYLAVRDEFEQVCWWEAKTLERIESPSFKEAAELRDQVEKMRALIEAKRAKKKPKLTGDVAARDVGGDT